MAEQSGIMEMLQQALAARGGGLRSGGSLQMSPAEVQAMLGSMLPGTTALSGGARMLPADFNALRGMAPPAAATSTLDSIANLLSILGGGTIAGVAGQELTRPAPPPTPYHNTAPRG